MLCANVERINSFDPRAAHASDPAAGLPHSRFALGAASGWCGPGLANADRTGSTAALARWRLCPSSPVLDVTLSAVPRRSRRCHRGGRRAADCPPLAVATVRLW